MNLRRSIYAEMRNGNGFVLELSKPLFNSEGSGKVYESKTYSCRLQLDRKMPSISDNTRKLKCLGMACIMKHVEEYTLVKIPLKRPFTKPLVTPLFSKLNMEVLTVPDVAEF